MCGIAGMIGNRDTGHVTRMIEAIHHRGPDHSAVFTREKVSLGHARLSIIDTSSGAHQPMLSPDERTALVFNGEIYNFSELRAELEHGGYSFRTSSDTEVILHLYHRDGISCFERMVGMFAIALYDFKKDRLVLARDRMGEKPLYWSLRDGVLLFASEPKALLASRLIPKEVDPVAVQEYLQFDYVPTPHCIFNGVHKLEPGTSLTFENGRITTHSFWNPSFEVPPVLEPHALSTLDTLISRSVTRELVADVPIGVFLSGGLDSSAIAYYAARAADQQIKTFSIGFEEHNFDESPFARQVAKHLGTDHHERIVSVQNMLDLVPTLGHVLDEPVADASIIPTLLLSQFAREHVTVALGGDGGDELFAGYSIFHAEKAFRYYERLPHAVRSICAGTINLLPAMNSRHFSLAFAGKKFVSGSTDGALRRHLEWVGTFDMEKRASLLDDEIRDVVLPYIARTQTAHIGDPGNELLWQYARMYLMDEVLVKVDRSGMRYALETRAPLLDHTIVEYAFSLPFDLKYHRGTTKYLFKKLMTDKLPKNIVHRTKKGFGIPLAEWLRGPLKPLCEELLSEERIKNQDMFNPAYVTTLVKEHMEGRHNNRKELWNLMMFQLWHEQWMC